MKQQHRIAIFSTLVLAVGLTATDAGAAVKVGDDKTFANIGVLLQSRIETTQKASPDKDNYDFDTYLRRIRILLSGQLNDKINFFLETDNPNFGKRGATSVNTYIQDAFVELNLDPHIQLDFGMLLAPFSHMGMESAAALLSEDYHSALMKYPVGSNNVWRDWGVMVRGFIIERMLEYRLALFNGVHGDQALVDQGTAPNTYKQYTDPRNPNDAPRVTGRLTFNVFDAEGGPGVGGMYYKGIYLKETDAGLVSPKKIIAIGASFDYQPELNVTFDAPPTVAGATRGVADRTNYFAWDVDAFVDMPVTPDGLMAVTGQFNYYHWGYGDLTANSFKPGGSFQYPGSGFSSELGFRFDRYQIIGAVDYFSADRGTSVATTSASKAGDYLAYYGDLVYFLKALQLNFKLEAGMTRSGGNLGHGNQINYASLQTQFFF